MKNVGLDTPAKRARLPAGKSTYWVPVAGARGGESIGYRRLENKPGVWIARVISQKYRAEGKIGQADDQGAGPEALAYRDAMAVTLQWAQTKLQSLPLDASESDQDSPLTIRKVVEDYLAYRKTKPSPRSYDHARWRLEKYLLARPDLADIPLAAVTSDALKKWRKALPPQWCPSTLNRYLRDVKAAITRGVPDLTLPLAFRIALRNEPEPENSREIVPLLPVEIGRLVAAAFARDRGFGFLVMLLAITGNRGSQIARITVGDVQVQACRIMMPPSRKGKGNKKAILFPVPIAAEDMTEIAPLLDRPKGDLLLERVGVLEAVDLGLSTRRMRQAWQTCVQDAGLPEGTIPYSLRHSRIIHLLGSGVPIRFVALTHDTSVAMIEKHYSRFITSEVEQAVRDVTRPVTPAKVHRLEIVR